jgi:hypothetical protein
MTSAIIIFYYKIEYNISWLEQTKREFVAHQ